MKKNHHNEFRRRTGRAELKILALATFPFMFNSCDSGADDGTVGNWICAIVCLLAWLKGGK